MGFVRAGSDKETVMLFPLAKRRVGDVAKLRAYGNAINPQVAAEFIRAYMDIRL